MALRVADWSVTPASNTSVDGVAIGENAPFSNMNNMGRAIMAAVKYEVASMGSNVSAGAAPDIGSVGGALTILGVSTIAGFATAPAGLVRTLHFETATPIVPGANLGAPWSSQTASKGAVMTVRSLGAGAWKIENYFPAAGDLGSTGAQTITTTSTGTLLTLRTSEDSASEGPTLLLDRNSASPAAADVIGAVNFQGRDSGGNTISYGRMRGVIVDPTDGSEDGQFVIVCPIAGAQTNVATLGAGLQVGTPTGTDKGVGTVNAAAGLYIAGHGTIAQVVTNTSVANTTLGTILPYDDTIPQSGEGDQIWSQAFTPINASSTIYIDVFLNIGTSSGAAASCALFVDAGANAVAAASVTMPNATSMMPLTLRYSVSAGSTSARTYALRAGASTASDAFLNGHFSSRIFGGVAVSSMTITEVLPQ